MIETSPPVQSGPGACLRLRPPRALTARQFGILFAVLSGAMWVVAGMAWMVGNAYAPAFALLDTVIVAAALRWMWRLGERDEWIEIGPQAVSVRRFQEEAVAFTAHPYWVRLRLYGDGERIELSSSGKRCVVGSFLGPGERRQLAERLDELITACSGRGA